MTDRIAVRPADASLAARPVSTPPAVLLPADAVLLVVPRPGEGCDVYTASERYAADGPLGDVVAGGGFTVASEGGEALFALGPLALGADWLPGGGTRITYAIVYEGQDRPVQATVEFPPAG